MAKVLEFAHGVDFSKHNILKDKHWVKPESTPYPIDFAIQRTGYSGKTDERYETLTHDINEVEICGAYHYYGSGTEWKRQADNILELTQNSPAKTKYHMIWLDYEGHAKWNWLTRNTAGDAHRIINYIDQNTAKEVRVGLYTNPSHYIVHLEPYGDWMKRFPLWLAQYWYFPNPFRKPGYKSGGVTMDYPYNTQIFYQYSADGNMKGKVYGFDSGAIDLNVSTKTLPELREWLSLSKQEEDVTNTTEDITPSTTPDDSQDAIVLIRDSIKVETSKIEASVSEITKLIGD